MSFWTKLSAIALATTVNIAVHSSAPAQTNLNDQAVDVAKRALGITNGISCGNDRGTWLQFKYVPSAPQSTSQPGFVQPLPVPVPPGDRSEYLDAAGMKGYEINPSTLNNSARLNGVTWSGIVRWPVTSYRKYSPGTGAVPTWTHRNSDSVLTVNLSLVRGQWQILRQYPPAAAVPHNECLDLELLGQRNVDDMQQRRRDRTNELLQEQRRQQEEMNRKYPVQPHVPDPYFRPGQR